MGMLVFLAIGRHIHNVGFALDFGPDIREIPLIEAPVVVAQPRDACADTRKW